MASVEYLEKLKQLQDRQHESEWSRLHWEQQLNLSGVTDTMLAKLKSARLENYLKKVREESKRSLLRNHQLMSDLDYLDMRATELDQEIQSLASIKAINETYLEKLYPGLWSQYAGDSSQPHPVRAQHSVSSIASPQPLVDARLAAVSVSSITSQQPIRDDARLAAVSVSSIASQQPSVDARLAAVSVSSIASQQPSVDARLAAVSVSSIASQQPSVYQQQVSAQPLIAVTQESVPPVVVDLPNDARLSTTNFSLGPINESSSTSEQQGIIEKMGSLPSQEVAVPLAPPQNAENGSLKSLDNQNCALSDIDLSSAQKTSPASSSHVTEPGYLVNTTPKSSPALDKVGGDAAGSSQRLSDVQSSGEVLGTLATDSSNNIVSARATVSNPVTSVAASTIQTKIKSSRSSTVTTDVTPSASVKASEVSVTQNVVPATSLTVPADTTGNRKKQKNSTPTPSATDLTSKAPIKSSELSVTQNVVSATSVTLPADVTSNQKKKANSTPAQTVTEVTPSASAKTSEASVPENIVSAISKTVSADVTGNQKTTNTSTPVPAVTSNAPINTSELSMAENSVSANISSNPVLNTSDVPTTSNVAIDSKVNNGSSSKNSFVNKFLQKKKRPKSSASKEKIPSSSKPLETSVEFSQDAKKSTVSTDSPAKLSRISSFLSKAGNVVHKSNKKMSSPEPHLSCAGLFHLLSVVEENVEKTSKLHLEEYYNANGPLPSQGVLEEVVSLANRQHALSYVNVSSVCHVIVNQISSICSSTAEGCLLTDHVLNILANQLHTQLDESDVRKYIDKSSVSIWDNLYLHWLCLIQHDPECTGELARIFGPLLISPNSVNQEKVISVLSHLLESAADVVSSPTPSVSDFSIASTPRNPSTSKQKSSDAESTPRDPSTSKQKSSDAESREPVLKQSKPSEAVSKEVVLGQTHNNPSSSKQKPLKAESKSTVLDQTRKESSTTKQKAASKEVVLEQTAKESVQGTLQKSQRQESSRDMPRDMQLEDGTLADENNMSRSFSLKQKDAYRQVLSFTGSSFNSSGALSMTFDPADETDDEDEVENAVKNYVVSTVNVPTKPSVPTTGQQPATSALSAPTATSKLLNASLESTAASLKKSSSARSNIVFKAAADFDLDDEDDEDISTLVTSLNRSTQSRDQHRFKDDFGDDDFDHF